MTDKKQILIVDDDTSLVNMFASKLSGAGFGVLSAYNGKEGLASAKKNKPDLILLDLRMPQMDGAETLEALSKDEETKNLKVFILSSFNDWSAMKMTQDTAKSLGALEFLEKGINLDELVAKVKAVLK